MTCPKDCRRASIRSGSSRAIETVWGHHAPSRPSPSSDAKLNRTGVLKRRAFNPLVTMSLSRLERSAKPPELQGDRCTSPCDPWRFLQFEADPHKCVGRLINRIALIVFGRVRARITVDYETVLPQHYTWEFADSHPPSTGSSSAWACARKVFCDSRKRAIVTARRGMSAMPVLPLPGMSFRIRSE